MPDIKIGKFDILATYTYAQALLHDVPDAEARQRGIVAAIVGARAKSGASPGSAFVLGLACQPEGYLDRRPPRRWSK